MLRKIVKIDADKCNGCGQCVTACVEGAIRLVEGKARVVSDSYCDGLGACIGECPTGALTIEEREAPAFDESAAMVHAKTESGPSTSAHACPGSAMRFMPRRVSQSVDEPIEEAPSELTQWPVQLKLVSPTAPCFEGADLLLTADCVPFAFADFHKRLLRGKALVIGCPKLDDAQFYVDKLTQILTHSAVKSLTVAHMEVPCCFGLGRIAEMAVANSGKRIPVTDVTIGIEGRVKE